MNTLIVYISENSIHSGEHVMDVHTDDWNNDLSPWKAKGVFKGGEFGGNADAFLADILLRIPENTYDRIVLTGYSLAGLFALYAGTKTDVFTDIVACSSSLWFEGFTEYLKDHPCLSKHVYLSLGDKESMSKNPVLRTVLDKTMEAVDILKPSTDVHFELREGGHFSDEEIWIGKGLDYLLDNRQTGIVVN